MNNAASAVSGQGTGLDSHSLEDMMAMMRLHVIAPFHFIKLLKTHLIQNKGMCVSSCLCVDNIDNIGLHSYDKEFTMLRFCVTYLSVNHIYKER